MQMNEYDKARAALAYVPNHERETWVRMGMALKAEFGEAGLDLWDEWSQGAESYNAADARAVWKSISEGGAITIASLYHEAKQAGWKPNGSGPVPPVSPQELAERERRRKEAQDREEREAAGAKANAAELWKQARDVGPDHPYLQRKWIQPVKSLRVIDSSTAAGILGYGPKCSDGALVGALIVAPLKCGEDFVSCELIDGDGKKIVPYGSKVGGAYWAAQPMPEHDGETATICIGEGIATMLSVKAATGCHAIAARSCVNLRPVAEAMRQRYPRAKIILCGDVGPGEDKARQAAAAVGGNLALPEFGADRPEGAKDFNDLHKLRGLEAVRKALGAAQTVPPMPEHRPSPENGSKAPSGGFVGAGEWPEPQALPDGLPAVKPFDADWLPDKLRPWVADIGDRLQCPLDFVAVAVMVSLGSVIGRRVGIRPQERTDWTEYANLWGCIVGRPSLMKSPAMERGLDPLRALAHRAVKAFEGERLEYDAKMTAHKVRRDLAGDEMKKRLKGNIMADVRDLQIPEPDEPQMRRYFTNDTSYEKLGDLHRANPNGLLVFRDELVSLLKTLDREDNAGARGFYLTGWSGNSPYVFDRMTREGAAIDAICLSVLGSTQPSRLAEYVRAAVKGGAGDDGLMQRFGLLVWPDTSSEWKDIDRWPDSDASLEAFNVFERMSALDTSAIGAQQDKDRDTGELRGQPYLRLDPEALGIFREWREEWERKCRSGSELPALESHFTKYRKLVPALALISHLADGTGGDVGSVAMLRSLAWAEYLEPHARRAYASLDAPEQAAAKAIIDRLRKGDLATEFKARDIYRKGWAHLTDPELVHNALRLLADFDWLAVREVSARETGGSPARIYVANPRGLK